MDVRLRLTILPLCAAVAFGCEGGDDVGEAEPEAPVEAGWTFGGATRATTDGPGAVTVFWAPATAEVEYRLHVATGPDDPDPSAEPAAVAAWGATSHTLTGLSAGGQVRVLVRARDSGGVEDDNTSVVSASTDLPVLRPGEVWAKDLPYGAFSSPGLGDFDGDGALDLAFGTGAHNVRGEVVALSGVDGDEIWRREVTGEVVGSPAVADLDGDGTPDVIVGGRDIELWALNGRDGEVMWAFETTAWLATPARLDLGGDVGFVVTVGGLGPLRLDEGDPNVDPHDPDLRKDRWSAGRLYGIDGATGRELGRVSTEEFEYYASPAVGDLDGDGSPEVVVGSGGHDKAGETFVVSPADGWSRRWGQPSDHKGVVASPCLADLDGDGLLDVASASEAGFAAGYRGTDGAELWRWEEAGYEFVASPSMGWSHRSATPGVLVAAAEGTWDTGYRRGRRALLDGATGRAHWEQEAAGRFLLATPLWVDLTGNDLDDLVLSEVEFNPHFGLFWTRLLLIHGATGERMGSVEQDAAIISTPVIGDIDADGSLDLLWVGFQGPVDQRGALPGRVGRVDLGVPSPPQGISWDRFRGNPDNTGALATPPPPR